MNYLSALAIILGIVSGSISIYEFIKKGSWRPGVAFSIAAVILLIAAIVVANLPSPSGNQAPGFPFVQNSSTPQFGTNATPVQPTQQAPLPTPTPTQPNAGTQLYQNDPNWTNWTANGWSVLDGNLITSQGTQDSQTIIAPYHPSEENVPDYSVTVVMTVIHYNNCYRCGFGIAARANVDDSNSGYTLSVCAVAGLQTCNQDNEDNYLAFLLGGQNYPDGGTVLAQTHFQPIEGKQHTYRLDCKGGTITGYIDAETSPG